MSAIVVTQLSKQYGAFIAIDDVSFDIAPGEVVALLGPNGAGKTTITEILAGFLAPTSGVVQVLGVDPRRGGRAWRARIGLVLQSTSLDRQLTVAEVLGAYARVYPRAMSVAEVLEVIDLAADADTRIASLSGGQRRRVDVGLGMIGRPELLFLDEPTTGLDPHVRRGVWASVEDLTAAGTTVLMTSHYLDEAQQIADRVIVLGDGRVVADATPDQLRTRSAATVIRWPLPVGAPVGDLPPALVGHLDAERGDLVVPSRDVSRDLEELLGWAHRNRIDLAGLQVGPPSLEDAYLALTDSRPRSEGFAR